MTRRELVKGLVVAGAGALAPACGYSLAGRGSFLPDYIRAIGIPMFGNTTPYQTMELVFTEKVRIEFQSRGQYVVTPVDTGVDGVVRGTIVSIGAAPVGFTDARLASRYRFTIIVSVKFEDVKQQKALWENPAVTFSDEYELATQAVQTGDATQFLGQERAAVDRMSSDFARTVVSAILEAF